MAFNFTLPLRILQALFALIVLGCTSWIVSLYDVPGVRAPSSISFLLFTSIWTLLALIYLIVAPARFPQYAHKFGILGVEAVTMLFWFAGFIAAAVLLFTATTAMAALHVWRTRNTQNKNMDPNMAVHNGV
ncbi:hypothetical protein H2201_003782 [Coniosporium apollinis]|uniref:MARVEL domain-containing protein n=1 Tax=Coniosporium apollinis TaxID=61459 RepID=A0ABQ9NUL3_9PEZI|nr:hypothetical protein H2201_003782 [Coniosporium apollinis]